MCAIFRVACTLGGGFMLCDATSVVDMLLLAFNVVGTIVDDYCAGYVST